MVIKDGIGVMNGTDTDLSAHYKKLRDDHHYPIYVGSEFWARLTGDKMFFEKLTKVIAETVQEANSSQLIEEVIQELSQDKEIIALATGARTSVR
jgi:hypothetical protein